MRNKLTLKQGILNTFKHKTIDRIVFSPRLYYWYLENKLYQKPKKGRKFHSEIPAHYIGKSQLEIYGFLGGSPRYVFETLYMPLYRENLMKEGDIQIKDKVGSRKTEIITTYKTPVGNLEKITNGGHITEYPLKTIEDLKIMKYILKYTSIQFLERNFKKSEELLGENGIPCTYFPRSPYQRLIIDYMGFSKTILLLKKYPTKMENFMKYIEEWDDKMYDILIKSPLEVVNFGENIDANLSPPKYFEKYLIPYYEKRVKQFHKVGKYCHIHIDGSLKDLLPYLSEMSFDGYEALTAKPQGDVTLEEIKKAIGNKVLLDGLPSILFLPQYSIEYVKDYTLKVLNIFSPNLILGVSDELSPNGQINKIEIIADIVRSYDIENK